MNVLPVPESAQQAMIALQKGDKTRANELLKQAIEKHPLDERLWLWLSWTTQSDEECQACIEKIRQINPNNPVLNQNNAENMDTLSATPLSFSATMHRLQAKKNKGETAKSVKKDSVQVDMSSSEEQKAVSDVSEGQEASKHVAPPSQGGDALSPNPSPKGQEASDPIISPSPLGKRGQGGENTPTASDGEAIALDLPLKAEQVPATKVASNNTPTQTVEQVTMVTTEVGISQAINNGVPTTQLPSAPSTHHSPPVSSSPQQSEKDEIFSFILTIPDVSLKTVLIIGGFILVILVFLMSVWILMNMKPSI